MKKPWLVHMVWVVGVVAAIWWGVTHQVRDVPRFEWVRGELVWNWGKP